MSIALISTTIVCSLINFMLSEFPRMSTLKLKNKIALPLKNIEDKFEWIKIYGQ